MRILRAATAIVLPLLLAGCYSSTKPLISADKAVFPYETITYSESSEDKPQTMTHEGDAYVMKNDKGDTVELLFMPVKDDFYVVQMGGKTDAGEAYLYGLLKLDAAGKKADVYAMMADKTDIGPGLPACPDSDSTVCIADMQAYIDHAMGMIDKGPAATYTLVDLK